MMEMKDLIVGRRANATTTYTEVEPEGEEPLAGLAGVRQRGGRWRRITLACVVMLIVIGIPLFVYLTVEAKEKCSSDYWERPELIEDDITIFQLTQDTTNYALVFYTITDISDKVCTAWKSSFESTTEVSYFFSTLLTWKNGSWTGPYAMPVNTTSLGSTNSYIQSSAIVGGNPVLLLQDWVLNKWSLVTVVDWQVTPAFSEMASKTLSETDGNLAYSLHTLSNGDVILLREQENMNTGSKELGISHVVPNVNPFEKYCTVSLNASMSTFWWSVGSVNGKQYISLGNEYVKMSKQGSVVTSAFGVCELDLSNDEQCCNVVQSWDKSLKAVYWDASTNLTLVEDSSANVSCHWINISNPSQTTPATDYAQLFCENGPSARLVNNYWQLPNMEDHTIASIPSPILSNNVLSTTCHGPTDVQNHFVALISRNLGKANQLLLWVVGSFYAKDPKRLEVASNWIALPNKDAPLQCPCQPNFEVNPCPPSYPPS